MVVPACDTPAVTAMRDLADRLEAGAAAIAELGAAIDAGEPWPLTEVYGPGPESAWGPRELLAHVGEMLPFWLGEIELVLAESGRAGAGADPPSFGRTEQDPLRIEVIGRDRMFPARELVDRVDVEGARVARRLRALTDAQAATLGRHVTRGDLSVADMAERFLVTHIEGHVEQLKEILATAR
jgi:DinB family protein